MRLIKVMFIICAILVPARLFAEAPYIKHCAACHGKEAEGGFGPALAGAISPKASFEKIVREGKGMMPAISKKDLNDKELNDIYLELISESKKSIEGNWQILSFVTKNVRLIAWGSVGLMCLGWGFILFAKYIRWSAFSDAMRYFKLLGVGKFFKITTRVFFCDTFAISSLYKKDKRRWLIHGLMAYGFFGLIVVDIFIGIFNPERATLPLFSPLKIFANVCGLTVLLSLTIVLWRFFTDPFEQNGVTFLGDVIFVLLLFFVVATGFVTEATRYLKLLEYTPTIYFAHIVFVIALFLTAPFTRFIHLLSTFFFVLNTRLSIAVAEGGYSPKFKEEPAPARHFKSKRIAKELFGNETRIRYFP